MIIKNLTSKKVLASKAWLCEGLNRFKGLMFKQINEKEACVLINPYNDDSCSIHMLFVPQELDIIWVSDDMKVQQVKHAKKWRFYNPHCKAKYVIELLNSKGTKIGDKIKFLG